MRSGDVLGRYELGEELGEGGMATVFRARDRELRRDVAVKVLFPHLARRVEIVKRFHREARAAAGLEHPNILRIYDVGGGEDDDPPYIVMELIRGRTLLEEIEQRGPMLAEIAACVGALLADGLAAAHAASIVHRDIKPSNVLVAQGGRLLLADFGVARLETENSLVTRTGALLGTPAYMSPEQASGDTATARSDLYSLGATLYQLATGHLPYGGSAAKVMSQIAAGALVSPVRRRAAVGPDLSRLIEQMMASDPEHRPASAATLAAELRAFAAKGGFADPKEELAAYFADPAVFVQIKTPAIVSALLVTAERAIADDKLPRAMALADRASALAPNDPAVNALIEKVTEGGRASRRRKLIAVAGIGLAVAGGATALGLSMMRRGSSTATPDAAIALASAAPEGLVDADRDESNDARPVDADRDGAGNARPVDADRDGGGNAGPVDERLDARPGGVRTSDAGVHVASNDARPQARAIDAGAPDAHLRAISIDAAPPMVAIDAGPPPDATVIAHGNIVVVNDTWCEVSIDGVLRGKLPQQSTFDVPAGHHTVVCKQPGIAETRSTITEWSKPVHVTGGKTVRVEGAMLAPVEVRFEVAAQIGDTRFAKGDVRKLKPGRTNVIVDGQSLWLDIPRVPCRLRKDAGRLVCDP